VAPQRSGGMGPIGGGCAVFIILCIILCLGGGVILIEVGLHETPQVGSTAR